MGWVDALAGATVALDAAPLIYYMERHPHYHPLVKPFFEALDQGAFRGVASTVVLLEVLVLPLRRNDQHLAQAYCDILQGTTMLTLIPVSPEIAEGAARLRADVSIKTPDAIHLATAQQQRATAFITNDTRLPPIPGLQIISLDTLLAGHV